MTALIIAFVLFLAPTVAAKAQATRKAVAPLRVGQVFIVGNERTKDHIILRQVRIEPGQILNYADLRRAREKLEGLDIFKPGSVKVTAENDPNNPDSVYKNIFVYVEETSTGKLRMMSGLNCFGEPVASLVWEERNFDPSRFPTSIDDLMDGGAFRGAGQTFRLELVQIPLTGLISPRFLQLNSILVSLGRRP